MTVKTAKGRPGLAGKEAFFVIDQNRSSANWPLAKILQHYSNAETGFNRDRLSSLIENKMTKGVIFRNLHFQRFEYRYIYTNSLYQQK